MCGESLSLSLCEVQAQRYHCFPDWNNRLSVPVEDGVRHVLDIICLWTDNTVALYVLINSEGLSSLSGSFVILINLEANLKTQCCCFIKGKGFKDS